MRTTMGRSGKSSRSPSNRPPNCRYPIWRSAYSACSFAYFMPYGSYDPVSEEWMNCLSASRALKLKRVKKSEPANAPALVRRAFKPRSTGVFKSILIALLLVLCGLSGSSAQGQTFGCSPAMANDIVCENSKIGNPSSEWDVTGGGDTTIQGFATDISVNQGGTVVFKILTNARAYTINIYRLGYYGGMGARKIATVN